MFDCRMYNVTVGSADRHQATIDNIVQYMTYMLNGVRACCQSDVLLSGRREHFYTVFFITPCTGGEADFQLGDNLRLSPTLLFLFFNTEEKMSKLVNFYPT